MKNIIHELTTHQSKKYRKRTLEGVDTIMLHHSAASMDYRASNFADWHVNGNNWPGIGYHFVIDPDGTINVTNYLDTLSYHASGWNTRSIGICTVGNFDKYKPTDLQITSIYSTINLLRRLLGELQIKGHRDTKATSCPGALFPLEIIKRDF